MRYSLQRPMTVIQGLIIFFAIIGTYALIVYGLHKKGILKKFNMSFMGPALMWRTTRGRNLLKKIAHWKRFWRGFGTTSVFICFVAMMLMTLLLIWQAWFVSGFTQEQKDALPGPEIALILPGINPILPLEFIGYIIIAFIVAIIVHEFSHGILTYASKLKVKSLGILYLIIPIGAFVEPDEEALKKAKITARMRIYAAGPTANFVAVVLTIFVFSFLLMSVVQPAANGVSILYVGEDTPAETIGLAPGMIITEINGTQTSNMTRFYDALEPTNANQQISLQYAKGTNTFTKTVVLADKANYTQNLSHQGQGYLGVATSEIHKGFLTVLQNPFDRFPDGFLLFYIIPLWGYFQGYNPIVSPFTDSYVVTGPLSFLPSEIFWVLINAFYWIFWLNFAVALFNVLPMLPLDGGFLFNDAIGGLVKKLKKTSTEEQRQIIIKNISLVLSLIILFLIIFPFIIKYI